MSDFSKLGDAEWATKALALSKLEDEEWAAQAFARGKFGVAECVARALALSEVGVAEWVAQALAWEEILEEYSEDDPFSTAPSPARPSSAVTSNSVTSSPDTSESDETSSGYEQDVGSDDDSLTSPETCPSSPFSADDHICTVSGVDRHRTQRWIALLERVAFECDESSSAPASPCAIEAKMPESKGPSPQPMPLPEGSELENALRENYNTVFDPSSPGAQLRLKARCDPAREDDRLELYERMCRAAAAPRTIHQRMSATLLTRSTTPFEYGSEIIPSQSLTFRGRFHTM